MNTVYVFTLVLLALSGHPEYVPNGGAMNALAISEVVSTEAECNKAMADFAMNIANDPHATQLRVHTLTCTKVEYDAGTAQKMSTESIKNYSNIELCGNYAGFAHDFATMRASGIERSFAWNELEKILKQQYRSGIPRSLTDELHRAFDFAYNSKQTPAEVEKAYFRACETRFKTSRSI